jgi:RNA recognition motif-containing protein
VNIYVANISYHTTEEKMKELFEEFGSVESVRIIVDKNTAKSRGFGFVEMPNDDEGKKAVEALNGKDFLGRNLVVNEARPKAQGRRDNEY